MTPKAKIDRATLKRNIRQSRVLGAELRRFWLQVLPHLDERDCARLQELLDQERDKLANDQRRRSVQGSLLIV